MSIRKISESYDSNEVSFFRITYKPSAEANHYNTNLIKVGSATEAREKLAKVKPGAEFIAASPVFNGSELDSLLDRGMPIIGETADEAYIVKPEVDLFNDDEDFHSYSYNSSGDNLDWCECNDCGWYGESDALINNELCPDCGCGDIIREPMTESKSNKQTMKESSDKAYKYNINFGHWIGSKNFTNKTDLMKFLRTHVIAAQSIITESRTCTSDYEKTMHIESNETLKKFNLSPNQMHELFKQGYTKIEKDPTLDEQMQRNPEDDGWPGIVKDNTAQFFNRARAIKYEIDNCVRGAYAIKGDKTEDLISSLKELRSDLDGAIKILSMDKIEINESIDDSTIEDIDSFITDVKNRFPGSDAFYDGNTNTIKITLSNDKLNESVSADEVVTIGLYGDEVDGYTSVDQLAQAFEDRGIEILEKSGDFDFGWDLEVRGNARDIYNLVNNKITGYNCSSTQEFVDRYRIDEGIVHNADHISMAISDMIKKNGIDYCTITNHNNYADIEFYSDKAANKASKLDWKSAGFGDFKVNGSNATIIIKRNSNLDESKSINEEYSEYDISVNAWYGWYQPLGTPGNPNRDKIWVYFPFVTSTSDYDEAKELFLDSLPCNIKSSKFCGSRLTALCKNDGMTELDVSPLNESKSLKEELWDKSRVTDLVTYYLDRNNVPVNTLANLIKSQMEKEGSKLPYNITDFYDQLYMAIDNYNAQSEDGLTESLDEKALKELNWLLDGILDCDTEQGLDKDALKFLQSRARYMKKQLDKTNELNESAAQNIDMDLFKYILDECLSVYRRGDYEFQEFPTYEEIVDTYDDRITKKDYNKVINTINNLPDLKFYTSDNTTYLQLSDEHTLFKIDSEIDDVSYNLLVDDAAEAFESKTGVNVFGLGRSGRHICVENTPENILHYKELCNIQSELEQKVIDIANNYKPDDLLESLENAHLNDELDLFIADALSDGSMTEKEIIKLAKQSSIIEIDDVNSAISKAKSNITESFQQPLDIEDAKNIIATAYSYDQGEDGSGRLQNMIEEFLFANGASEDNMSIFDGVSDEVVRELYDKVYDYYKNYIQKYGSDDINCRVYDELNLSQFELNESISSVEPTSPFKRGVKTTSCLTKNRKWDVTVDETGNIIARSRHAKPEYFKGHINDSVNDFPYTVEDNIILAAREQFNIKFGNDNAEPVTEDINVRDNVKISTPGNIYYDGRTGVVDFIDDKIATVLFDDNQFPKMNNFDLNQLIKL